MAENVCNGNHKYGLWENNSRTCFICGYKETLPINETIKNEMKKQVNLTDFLKKFLSIEDNHIEAIKGIQIILEKHLNYLSTDSLSQFQDKVKQIGIANNLHEVSIGCILLYVEKLKKHETITEFVSNAFDQFITIFNEEINDMISSYYEEKKATLS